MFMWLKKVGEQMIAERRIAICFLEGKKNIWFRVYTFRSIDYSR